MTAVPVPGVHSKTNKTNEYSKRSGEKTFTVKQVRRACLSCATPVRPEPNLTREPPGLACSPWLWYTLSGGNACTQDEPQKGYIRVYSSLHTANRPG